MLNASCCWSCLISSGSVSSRTPARSLESEPHHRHWPLQLPHQGEVDPRSRSGQTVPNEAHLVVEVAEGVSQHTEQSSSPMGRLEQRLVAGQLEEVPKDCRNRNAVLTGQHLRRLLASHSQQRLTHIEQEQS